MKVYLERQTYFYEDYKLQNIKNFYIVKGIGQSVYKPTNGLLEELVKDIYLLGKSLLLKIENVSSFSKFLGKSKSKYEVKFLPFYENISEVKEDKLNININSIAFGYDITPNNNGLIEINNYLEHLSNPSIQTLILDFCKKHGLPYHENVELSIIQEGLKSDIPMSVNIRDLILTSITIYLLSELKRYLAKEIIPYSTICKIMSLPNSSTSKDMNNRFNMYINAFQDTYVNVLSKYGDYTTPIQFKSNKTSMYIKTCNLVQAVSYYFITYILLGNFNICCSCYIPTTKYRKGLCEECYSINPDYVRNKERRELNAIASELITKLKLLNSEDINTKISKIDYNVKNPKEDKIYELMELWNNQKTD